MNNSNTDKQKKRVIVKVIIKEDLTGRGDIIQPSELGGRLPMAAS